MPNRPAIQMRVLTGVEVAVEVEVRVEGVVEDEAEIEDGIEGGACSYAVRVGAWRRVVRWVRYIVV